MKISSQSVVALTWVLKDAQGEVLDELDQPVEFLMGSDDLLPAIETTLMGKSVGDKAQLLLEPVDAFGDYDEMLVLLEPRDAFPDLLEEGMIFETLPQGCSTPEKPAPFYAVSEIYPEHVVLDGNHPLAGMALDIDIKITGVRDATLDEVGRGSVGTGFFKILPGPVVVPPNPTLH